MYIHVYILLMHAFTPCTVGKQEKRRIKDKDKRKNENKEGKIEKIIEKQNKEMYA